MISKEMERVTADCRVEAVDVLREILAIATADPSKIVQQRRVNCRHCHGLGYEYQWKAREYAEACDHEVRAAAASKPPRLPEMPDCSGGFGFRRTAEPNPDCPECEGQGKEHVFIADTESLTGPERKLIAGIKQTRDGVEVKMRDQDGAMKMLATYAGLLIERKELTGKDGKPLMPAAPPVELPNDPQQLGALYGQIVGQ